MNIKTAAATCWISIARYLIVLVVLLIVWVGYYWFIRWVTADCWFMKMNIKAAVEKKC